MSEQLAAEERVCKYLRERAKITMLDRDDIHSLHIGTDRESHLMADDLIEILTELARLRNMDPGEFEDAYMASHPFVCDGCRGDSHAMYHSNNVFFTVPNSESHKRRERGECGSVRSSKINHARFYCSCEWRPEEVR